MEQINKALILQDERLESITKSEKNYGKSPKSRLTLSYVQTRLENLEATWNSFKTTHENLVTNTPSETKSAIRYFNEDLFETCEEVYINYKSDLKTKISELSFTTPSAVAPEHKKTTAEIKLPTINIPQFSGKYTEWPSFHDLFTSIIHTNKSIDEVQKLHYLKSSLTGEAEQLLRTIPVTSKNYNQAWETLTNRYNNKRYIANSIFKKLFSIKSITSESAYQIKYILDTTVECLNSLKNLQLPVNYWDAIIIYLTVSKLDTESHRLWEQLTAIEKEELPSFDTLKDFLETRFRSLEMIEHTTKPNRTKTFHTSLEPTNISCVFCKEAHYIYQCKQFAKLQYKDRHDFVQNNNLCFNCLIPNHSAVKCMRKTSCRVCHKKHHSLLHPEKRDELVRENCHKDSNQNIASHFVHQPGQILLATALVDATSRQGQKYTYRALIDQGSQATFVTEDLVQTLGLKKMRISGVVSGLNEGKQLHTKYMVEVQLQSRYYTNFTIRVKAYILKNITTYLPQQSITVSNWPELEEITLADPNYNTPNKVQILLGAEVYSQIIEAGLMKSPSGIIAQKTQLGWILSGDASRIPVKENKIISMHVCMCENDLLRKFWEVENEVLTSERNLTKDEQRCEDIYKKTTVRTDSGRYKVDLPFRENIDTPVDKCGFTKDIAISRFLQLERKLNKNKEMKNEYTKVIKEYEELGHMQLTTENERNCVYLPHHAVIRDDKDTSKLRVVFDASAKGSKGQSLNDTLLTGPVIQDDLPTLILRWRQHKIALISDIVKMYRQILITEKHTNYQCIIWRDNENEEFKVYKLLTVTFGTACAPFLAVRTLKQIAEEVADEYPQAAEIIKSSFYMDDLMTGACTENEAKEIYEQVNKILERAGFVLQKWSSNSDNLLNMIQQNKEQTQPFEIKLDRVIKILGVSWDRDDDKFKISVNLPEPIQPITKRRVLSDIARLFDPFGWLAPVIINAKVLIQKLWLCHAEWDEELPNNLLEDWLKFREQLQTLQNIKIDRWIHTYADNDRIELVGFADASTKAYAAVIYLRVIQGNDVHVTILESKTKVAPLKQVSVPRLELCAAVLLAKLLTKVASVLKIPKTQVYAYTDSTIVLAWIQSQPIRWQTFVANRITEIQTRLDNDRWNHVTSAENPADIASRGIEPAELQDNILWWRGPEWMKRPEIHINKIEVPETKLEERKQHTKVFHNPMEEEPIINRFSNLQRMVRVLTYCRRFLSLKERKQNKIKVDTYLTAEEMQETLDICLRTAQETEFAEELEDLKQKGKIKKRSKLISLNPYRDERGLLRVGGRLQAAQATLDYKHPIIIPKNTHIGELIIKDAHERVMHGGTALTINLITSKYWMIGLKPAVKKYIKKCVTCVRYNARTHQPIMGELPSVRVTPGRPFESSGVDFAGPIQMRVSKGRGQKSYKGYISLFVCMKTKAIHLEAVSDLTTAGFIAAFRRFVSRRGHCSHMWSDNGLNFVGAANELTRMLEKSMTGVVKEIAETLENDGTTWHFIPPRSPNFGGLWESNVKAVKTHLVKTIGLSTLTFEELSTVLCQIEAVINSRPLTGLNDNPDDLSPLTPAHFLVGEPSMVVPEPNVKDDTISPLQRWRITQKMLNNFWIRWSKEYLNRLQQRHKWQTKAEGPRVGDLVILKEADLPPAKWLMGRVTDVNPGPDNEVRVVTLKTKTSTLRRPVSKLIILP